MDLGSPFSSKPIILPLSACSHHVPRCWFSCSGQGSWTHRQTAQQPGQPHIHPGSLISSLPTLPFSVLLRLRSVNPPSSQTFLPEDQSQELSMVLLCPSSSCAPLPRVGSLWSERIVSIWTLGPPPQDHTQTWPQVPFQGLCIFPGSILLLADLHAGGPSKGQLFTKGYRNNLTVSAKGSKRAYLASSRHEMEGREGEGGCGPTRANTACATTFQGLIL